MVSCFGAVAQDSSCRAVVVSGAGTVFSAGIDLASLGSAVLALPGDDAARRGWNLRRKIRDLQQSFTALEKVSADRRTGGRTDGPDRQGTEADRGTDRGTRVPVPAELHRAGEGERGQTDRGTDRRTGGRTHTGTDRQTGGQTGDRQGDRLSPSVLNVSPCDPNESPGVPSVSPGVLKCVPMSPVCPHSRVFADKEALLAGALEVAVAIAARSPVAVQGTKVNLLFSRDHSVPEGLRYVATWNMAMLQTEDILKSVQASMDKKGPEDVPFAKL
ncbi:enoyl CoA hydratase 1, peroxisomal [Columba livia]|uniref:Enoyl CoA hydratase 1, peroxisomal n=1 Tax=Columba livia TaxID=8932 RepID=A0A2I0LH52_COLLI|nr:enoyl CoA hydratase 1, peroxisomal [Columba livia]